MLDEESEKSLSVLHNLYSALGNGDVKEALTYVDPEIVITFPSSLPMGGEWRGHDGMLKLFGAVRQLWTDRVAEDESFVAQGELVIVFLTTKGKIRGKALTMPMAEVWRVRAGKIVEGRVFYWDTVEIAAAVAGPAVA